MPLFTVKNGKVVKSDKADDSEKFPSLNISPATAKALLEIALQDGISPALSTKGEGKGKPSPSSVKAIVHCTVNGLIDAFIATRQKKA